MQVSKSKNNDVDGGMVEVKRLDNSSSPLSGLTQTVLSDTDEYDTILKNKLHHVCAIVVLFHASTMKVEGSSVQVEIQALQSEPIFKVHPIQEHGEPSDVMGKAPPNEYSFSRLPIANDPVDDFDGISGISYVNCQKLNGYVKRSKLRVLWDDSSGAENYKWLSELRLQCRDDTYQWATESSFFIIWGSFWNCEFRLFCYGPLSANEGSIATEISKFYKPFLSKDLSKLVCESDKFCGLILIGLISSGKIEAQRYCALLDLVQNFDVAHREPLFKFEDSLLYSLGDDEYEFPKRDEMWANSQRLKQFLLYNPVVGEARGNRIYNDVKFTTIITKVHKVTDPNDTMDSSVGLELFDHICPIEFKFDVPVMNFVLTDALCLIEEWLLAEVIEWLMKIVEELFSLSCLFFFLLIKLFLYFLEFLSSFPSFSVVFGFSISVHNILVENCGCHWILE
ncbi:hypothetical protein GOBAR_AA08185 [Gossypium barbadense]|uniref:Uncharacterized protein n=1 Tax=Gossypium barbadense TaxID=3634 RepID=A0A2P5YA28_GOSBA|nr:hypothetical protein GOBAR_AA08185 [Gossypium barbadense]